MTVSERTLVDRLERLESLELARDLESQYAQAVDSGEPRRVAELFTEDGVLAIPSGDIIGRKAIDDFYQVRMVGSEKRHFLANVFARCDGEGTVKVDSYYFFTSREAELSGLGWGQYESLIRVTGDGAKFMRKQISPAITTDLSGGWAL